MVSRLQAGNAASVQSISMPACELLVTHVVEQGSTASHIETRVFLLLAAQW